MYVHVGFFEEALEHAATALAINPSNAQALNSRAQALLWMGKDEEALAVLLSIPGPVLPELVEANTAFALLRLGRREEAWAQLRRALRKYPNDPSGALLGIEAMLLAESEPLKAQELIENVAKRKAVNPSHHAAYFAASALARMRRAAGGRPVVARSRRDRVPVLSVICARCQPGSDTPGPAFPGVSRGHAETVSVPQDGSSVLCH